MRFRRLLTPTATPVRTSVNISETYRGHGLRVVVTRSGVARMTCVTYVDGKQVGFDIVLGNEAEALVEGVKIGVRTVDRWYPDETHRGNPEEGPLDRTMDS